MLALFLIGLSAFASANKYHGYQLVSVIPQSAEDISLIKEAVDILALDQWTSSTAVGKSIDILMSPVQAKIFSSFFSPSVPVSVKIGDVQKVIDAQAALRKNFPKSSSEFDHTRYRSVADIHTTLGKLVNKFPALVSNYVAGTTYLKRDIIVTVVSSDGSDSKEVIWLDCGCHAREWLSPATCQWILDKLTSGYGFEDDVTAVLDMYDFHIMTLCNPDGYSFTMKKDRLWRKNRVYYGNTSCFGVDPNRNFDSNFGGKGSSADPCAENYHGPSAFSEAESSAIRDSIVKLGSRTKMYISIHAFSQLLLTPYGYTFDTPTNYHEQIRVAEVAANAIAGVYGTKYTFGNAANITYLAAGCSLDWIYDRVGIQYSYVLELRDSGYWGFLVPAYEIIPTGKETWAGILAAVNAI